MDKMPDVRVCIAGKRGGQEERAAALYGIEFHPVKVAKAPARKLSAGTLKFPAEIGSAAATGVSTIKKLSPGVVVGFGGYVSFPATVGAALCKVPVYIHEQNAFAGKANRVLARFARGVFISYEETSGVFGQKSILTGNPSRFENVPLPSKEEARVKLGLDPVKRTVFVFGGSQGARSINTAAASFAASLGERADIQMLHLSGKANYEAVHDAYAGITSQDGIRVSILDYLDDMLSAYCAADVIVCRAGASTIAETCSIGIPSILVPFPFAADDHQRFNARAVARKGAAIMVDDTEFTGERMAAEVLALIDDPAACERMTKASRDSYTAGAAAKMLKTIESLLL